MGYRRRMNKTRHSNAYFQMIQQRCHELHYSPQKRDGEWAFVREQSLMASRQSVVAWQLYCAFKKSCYPAISSYYYDGEE